MIDSLEFELVVIIMTVIITSAFGGLLTYFKKKTICLQQLADDVQTLKKQTYRIEKALIVLVKLQEETVATLHPDIKPEWEDIVKELLKNDI